MAQRMPWEVDEVRFAEFKRELERLCEQSGYVLVHLTPIERSGLQHAKTSPNWAYNYLPWISAHFEQLPEKK